MGQPVGSVLEVRLNGTVNGQKTVSVFHYRVASQWSQQDLLNEYQAIYGQIKQLGAWDVITPYLALTCLNFSLETVALQFVHPIRYAASVFPNTGNGVYTDNAEIQNVALVIHKRTNLAGRKHVGRVHVPAIGTLQATAGEWSQDVMNKAADFATALNRRVFEDLGTGELRPCIYHRGPNENPKYTDILQTGTRVQVRTMRSRTIGVGI